MVESETGRTGKNMRNGGKSRLREWEFKEIWTDMEDTGDAMVNKREFLDSLEKFAEQHPECRGKRGIKILKSYCEEKIKNASNDLSMSDEDLQKDDPDAPYQQDNDSLIYKIYKTMNRKHRCDIWNHPESYQNPWRLFSWIVCMFMILVSLVALTYSFAGSFQRVEQMQWMRNSWEPVVAAISILNIIVLALRILSCRNPCYIFAKSETVEDADEDDEESYMTWFFWPNYAHAMNFVDLAACFPIVVLAIGGSRNNGWIRALMLLTLGHTRRLKAMQMSLTVPAETLFKSWEESGKLFFFVAFVMLACNAAIFELEKGTPYSKCPAARTKTLCGADSLKDKCWWSGESSRCVGLRFREGEDSASPYKSYAHTFWFTVTTMSTVGYGDMSPKTPLGQAIGIFTMLSLVLVFSVFAVAIFPSNFEAARQLYINREIERKVFADMAQRDAKMAQRDRNRAQIVIVQA